ncbi:MAG: hypothetical protein IJI14_02655 [Anaerolineaceae bacterium]|nr:hypothetical protein [Anaerolineaceae bacterium]
MIRNKKRLKAQASIEYMVLFPIFMVLVLAMVTISLQWHAFHVTAQSSLEAASRGLKVGNKASNAEAPYAEIEVHKSGDAKANRYAIESDYSKIIGYGSNGIAKNIMVNENYFNSGNPETYGYVQAPNNWDFIPCDIGCAN